MTKSLLYFFIVAAGIFLNTEVAYAEEAVAKIVAADTAWILIASALVMLMVPGLALFYGGMDRGKNVLSTLLMSFICLGLITLQWTLFGYSLAFGEGNKFIGDFSLFALNGVGLEPNGTIPHQLFMVFQMMFAILTPALISGAVVGRMKFSAYAVFVLLWATLVYDPLCHWVWGGGWLSDLGALDFAGGLVVHISSGVSALAACIVLGKRKGFPSAPMPPHSLPLTLLGAGLLWFGWFGFNAGSELAADATAASAFVVTQIATGTALLGWVFTEWIHRGKPTLLGAASGAVAGLVAITPACGFVGPISAIIIGALAGSICYMAVVAKNMFGYDDSLDVFAVHGIGGTVGAICTGLFATAAIGGTDGFFFGNPGQLMIQLKSVAAAWVYSFVVTFIILKAIDMVMGLRVSEEDEVQGLDLSLHGERGYTQ
ncbi:MAG TPA: ammonium transporter [Nitrospinota bacterium]|nr:ammonium transporter [Nitrospinota bacterium]|tara:strand:- start:964 stop:2250 length:1287 start_codon:yes stop_codon:yes gene_type:complete